MGMIDLIDDESRTVDQACRRGLNDIGIECSSLGGHQPGRLSEEHFENETILKKQCMA